VQVSNWSGYFDAVSVEEERTCALGVDGLVVCDANDLEEPSGEFAQVAAEGRQVCGLRTDQSGACYNTAGLVETHPGPLAQLAGLGFRWSLSPSGSFVSISGQTVPSGTFVQVSAGAPARPDGSGACAVRSSGLLSCFDFNGETTPVSGVVRQVTLSHQQGCAIREDRSLACWGENGFGQATPPCGTFTDASRGPNHGCAVRTDGGVSCWGRNAFGESSPPPGRFQRVSVNGSHSCGIRESGELACWGANEHGQSAPPTGTFTQVSAGGVYTCALDAGRSMVCWGERRAAYGSL
jgi:hypothetical protein